MTDAELAAAFRALGNPGRLKIVRIMAEKPDGVLQVELMTALNLAKPTISHHVAKLIRAGLVERRDDHRYHLLPKAVLALGDHLASLT